MRRALLAVALLAVGCKGSDGETLRKIARKTGQRLDCVARPGNEAWAPLRATRGEPPVAARVAARIRHDRFLAGYRLEVSGDGRGGVTLNGSVPDRSLKARAMDLARSTLGVESVEDQVKVGD